VRRDFVVVLNFNGGDDTDRCVRSLAVGSPEAVVLVVDNGSTVSPPYVPEDRWPGVSVVRTGDNLGFAGGMNVGIRRALADGADTVTVLNNDTVVPAGVVARLGEVAVTGAAVTPEVRYLDRPDDVWFGGGAVDPEPNLAHHEATGELSAPGADGLRRTEVLAGCCVTAAAGTWRTVGLFDERYFLNFEDSDWSLRAAAAGVPLLVDTTVTIQHAVSASFQGAYSFLGLYYYARNGLLFGRDHGHGPAQKVRFLRRHVLPGVLEPARHGDRRDTGRRLLVLAVAVGDLLLGRLGRCPSWLEERAARWARSSGG
jgi:GT2 family glycosyltransferase